MHDAVAIGFNGARTEFEFFGYLPAGQSVPNQSHDVLFFWAQEFNKRSFVSFQLGKIAVEQGREIGVACGHFHHGFLKNFQGLIFFDVTMDAYFLELM